MVSFLLSSGIADGKLLTGRFEYSLYKEVVWSRVPLAAGLLGQGVDCELG